MSGPRRGFKVYRSAAAAGRALPGSVAALGKFDGMHLGHRRVLSRALKRAKALKRRTLAVTFDPHPRAFLEKKPFKPLMSVKERVEVLKAFGLDAVVLLSFNRTFSRQSPETFVRRVLAGRLKVREVFVGKDFRFGRNRAGDVDSLKALEKELGFKIRPVPLARCKGRLVTSSRIRRLLAEGRRAEAAACLAA